MEDLQKMNSDFRKKNEIKIYPERCPRDSAYFEYAERLVDSGSEE